MKHIISLFFLVRPLNIITAIASVFIVYYMVNIDNFKLTIFPCIILACYMAAGNILNDLIDIESDKINKPNRPLINNSINTYLLIIIIIILFFIGAWFAMNINVYAMRIALFFALPGIISYELIFKTLLTNDTKKNDGKSSHITAKSVGKRIRFESFLSLKASTKNDELYPESQVT